MALNDPLGDMLTRIRNAQVARHETVAVPNSRIKQEIARVLKSEGFIRDFELPAGEKEKDIKIHLRYSGRRDPVVSGLKRISKPGLRVYSGSGEIPRVYGGLGVAILSTSKGVMSGGAARRMRVGGEVLCHVW